MLRIGHQIAARLLRSTGSRLQWPLKTTSTSFAIAPITTSSRKLQINEVVEEDKIENLVKAEDVSSLIKSGVHNDSLDSAFKVIETLAEWAHDKKIDFQSDVANDSNFGRLLEIIQKQAVSPEIKVLIKGMENLLKLGISDEAYVIESFGMMLLEIIKRRLIIFTESSSQSAENTLLWNVRRVTMSKLLSIFCFQIKHQNTGLQKKVLSETITAIERRWVEIKNCHEICAVCRNHTYFAHDFVGHIDDRTIELAENFKCIERYNVLNVYGKSGRRITPVLRTLAFYMAKQSNVFTPKQLANILFSMKRLQFPDEGLLGKVSRDIVSQVDDISDSKIVGRILFAMGQMRWRETRLLETLSKWIENNIKSCRVTDMTTIVVTLARLAYTPLNVDSLFRCVIPHLTTSTIDNPRIWLEVVWSLCILGRATNYHVASVLSSSFLSKLEMGPHGKKSIKLRLIYINALANLTMPLYGGEFLNLANFKDVIITHKRNKESLAAHIRNRLHNFLPPPNYIRSNIQTNMGIHVDNEFVVNENGMGLPVMDYTDDFGEVESPKPLPTRAVKIAMFVWDYYDYTIDSKELTGMNQTAVKLVEKQGYKVIHVPYFEYNMAENTIKNVQYLKTKINEAISVS